jgi:hypothetical protein
MPPLVQQFDLAKIFLQAQQATANRQRLEANREALERQRRQEAFAQKVQQAQARVFQAQTPQARQQAEADLGLLDSERLANIRAERRTQEAHDLEQSRKRRELTIDRNLAGAQVMEEMLPAAIVNTEAGPQVDIGALFGATSRMSQMAQQGLVDKAQAARMQQLFRQARQATARGAQGMLTGEQMAEEMRGVAGGVQELLAGAKQGVELFGDPDKRQRFQAQLEQIGGRAFEIAGGENDYEWQVKNNPEAVSQARSEIEASKLARAKATAPRFVIREGQEYDPVTKGARTKLQKDMFASQSMLSNLKSIDIERAGEFQTIQAGAKAAGAKILDAFGVLRQLGGASATEFIGGRRVFREKINRVFNSYRQQITGAAASFTELERLKNSIMNTDLGPEELKASYEAFVSEIERLDRIRRRVLRKGINISDPESFGIAIDEEYARDKGISYDEDVAPVIEDLRRRNPGISDEEIERNLEVLGL